MRRASKAEQLLADDPDIATYTSYVGQGSPRFRLGLNSVLPNPNFAQIVIVTKDIDVCERVKAGRPAGPVPRVGPDPMKVRAIADQVGGVMAENSKIIDRI